MKINKCPKCGREPSILIWRRNDDEETISGYEAECYDCGLHTGCCETRNEAITKWNELTKGENDETTKA